MKRLNGIDDDDANKNINNRELTKKRMHSTIDAEKNMELKKLASNSKYMSISYSKSQLLSVNK